MCVSARHDWFLFQATRLLCHIKQTQGQPVWQCHQEGCLRQWPLSSDMSTQRMMTTLLSHVSYIPAYVDHSAVTCLPNMWWPLRGLVTRAPVWSSCDISSWNIQMFPAFDSVLMTNQSVHVLWLLESDVTSFNLTAFLEHSCQADFSMLTMRVVTVVLSGSISS